MSNPLTPEEHRRRLMVQTQLVARGIRNGRVLTAMAKVPRHLFVPEQFRDRAYEDSALPLPCGQTISQPYMVAATCDQARIVSSDRVLEVGSGSGYQAAVLAELAEHVVTVERIAELAELARRNLEAAGYGAAGGHRGRVEVVHGDGSLGHRAGAPYDVIVVAAAAPRVPPALATQLADGGRLVIPVGTRAMQTLRVLSKHGRKLTEQEGEACVYVPLIGDAAWPEP